MDLPCSSYFLHSLLLQGVIRLLRITRNYLCSIKPFRWAVYSNLGRSATSHLAASLTNSSAPCSFLFTAEANSALNPTKLSLKKPATLSPKARLNSTSLQKIPTNGVKTVVMAAISPISSVLLAKSKAYNGFAYSIATHHISTMNSSMKSLQTLKFANTSTCHCNT